MKMERNKFKELSMMMEEEMGYGLNGMRMDRRSIKELTRMINKMV